MFTLVRKTIPAAFDGSSMRPFLHAASHFIRIHTSTALWRCLGGKPELSSASPSSLVSAPRRTRAWIPLVVRIAKNLLEHPAYLVGRVVRWVGWWWGSGVSGGPLGRWVVGDGGGGWWVVGGGCWSTPLTLVG